MQHPESTWASPLQTQGQDDQDWRNDVTDHTTRQCPHRGISGDSARERGVQWSEYSGTRESSISFVVDGGGRGCILLVVEFGKCHGPREQGRHGHLDVSALLCIEATSGRREEGL